VTETRKAGKIAQSAGKVTKAPKLVPVINVKKAAKTGKSSTEKPKPTNLVSPPQPNKSSIEEISDLLDNLPLNACVELTRRILSAVPTFILGRFDCRLS
jgi:hypothetical protein